MEPPDFRGIRNVFANGTEIYALITYLFEEAPEPPAVNMQWPLINIPMRKDVIARVRLTDAMFYYFQNAPIRWCTFSLIFK